MNRGTSGETCMHAPLVPVARVGAYGLRVGRGEGSGQQCDGPGVASPTGGLGCGQSATGWVLTCARPFRLSGLALVGCCVTECRCVLGSAVICVLGSAVTASVAPTSAVGVGASCCWLAALVHMSR